MRADLRAVWATLVLALLAATYQDAAADDDFYRGRTIDLYIGFGVGGTYDLYARAVANHLGRFIPGQPAIVPHSMPGAGGLVAANFMYKVAPRDGTALAITSQTMALDQVFGTAGITYDAQDFIWIGRIASAPSIFFTWHQSPTKSFADARERVTTMGSSGSGDTTDTPRALNALAGAKFKLVLGYRGSNDVALAVERGEVEGGYALWTDLKFRKADWLRDKLVNLLFLVADRRDKDYPDLPVAGDLPPTPEGKKILALFAAPVAVGRSLFTAPGVPDARVALLRQAFASTLKDPEFLADAQRIGLEVDPLGGAELQAQVRALMQTPSDLVAKAEEARRP
ncbi:MAG TPA: tripartite tricarboxylate transporter substrate-binding protein [Stellaceae bacterium]|nr:tripartite tricarboxylate transporter substrate-binding protein [Stellaceae bacterium]